MNDWFTMQTAIAFILGVLLSAMVKGLVSQARARLSS